MRRATEDIIVSRIKVLDVLDDSSYPSQKPAAEERLEERWELQEELNDCYA